MNSEVPSKKKKSARKRRDRKSRKRKIRNKTPTKKGKNLLLDEIINHTAEPN